jgi:hypothetical protein
MPYNLIAVYILLHVEVSNFQDSLYPFTLLRRKVSSVYGRAIAQAVSRWLPAAEARVRARVRSCGICGGQSGTVAGFLRVLWFPLPTFIPPISPQSPASINWGLYIRSIVAAVPSGLSLTQLNYKINNSVAFSLQANYTNRATAACRRS